MKKTPFFSILLLITSLAHAYPLPWPLNGFSVCHASHCGGRSTYVDGSWGPWDGVSSFSFIVHGSCPSTYHANSPLGMMLGGRTFNEIQCSTVTSYIYKDPPNSPYAQENISAYSDPATRQLGFIDNQGNVIRCFDDVELYEGSFPVNVHLKDKCTYNDIDSDHTDISRENITIHAERTY